MPPLLTGLKKTAYRRTKADMYQTIRRSAFAQHAAGQRWPYYITIVATEAKVRPGTVTEFMEKGVAFGGVRYPPILQDIAQMDKGVVETKPVEDETLTSDWFRNVLARPVGWRDELNRKGMREMWLDQWHAAETTPELRQRMYEFALAYAEGLPSKQMEPQHVAAHIKARVEEEIAALIEAQRQRRLDKIAELEKAKGSSAIRKAVT